MERVRVEGDAFERGLQQAKHFGPELLQQTRGQLAKLPAMPRPIPSWARTSFVHAVLSGLGRLHHARHRPMLKGHEGGKFQRGFEGLAEGFKVPLTHLYGFAAFEVESARFGFTLGCTSLAFSAEAHESGHATISYNHDFPPEFAAYPFVRENVPADGLSSLSISYPQTLGAIAGVNAAGLGVSLNHAWVRKLSAAAALPITLLVQDVLDRCATVDEAIAAISAVHVANGSMMTLVDAQGDRAAVELTPPGAFVRRTTGPVLHTFNAYQTEGARRLEVPIGAIGAGTIKGMDIHGSNLKRQARYDALGCARREQWSAQQVDAIMGDHGDGGRGCDTTICRHDDFMGITLLTARIDPAARTLEVGLGLACEAKRKVYGVPAAAMRAAA